MALEHFMAWSIFLALVLLMLGADLLLFHRKPREIRMGEALVGALVPVAAAILFGAGLFFAYNHHFLDLGIIPQSVRGTHAERLYPETGHEAALLFGTGYLVELSLSADNVFLFVVLMSFFKVPRALQHRVLFWGVLGAMVMRGIMIVVGATLLLLFQWVIYVFGAFLLLACVRMLRVRQEGPDPTNNIALRIVRRLVPIHDGYVGKQFFTTINARRAATTLLLVLVCIEFTDLIFALDSIPAIFGITRDTYIVFTSNVFAIIGLRSMYFLLAGVIDRFHYLKAGLAAVLGFVGVKMVLPGLGELYGRIAGGQHHWEVDKYLSLAVIVAALGLSIVVSLVFPRPPHTLDSVVESAPRAKRAVGA